MEGAFLPILKFYLRYPTVSVSVIGLDEAFLFLQIFLKSNGWSFPDYKKLVYSFFYFSILKILPHTSNQQNCRSRPPQGFTIYELSLPHSSFSGGGAVVRSNPCELFQPLQMFMKTVVLGFAWFVLGMVQFGLTFAANDLGGSFYINFILLSLSDIPGLLLQTFFQNRSDFDFLYIFYPSGVLCSEV